MFTAYIKYRDIQGVDHLIEFLLGIRTISKRYTYHSVKIIQIRKKEGHDIAFIISFILTVDFAAELIAETRKIENFDIFFQSCSLDAVLNGLDHRLIDIGCEYCKLFPVVHHALLC